MPIDFSARHIGFVLACYGISIAVLVIMSLAVVMRSRRLDKQLGRLENSRAKRKKASS